MSLVAKKEEVSELEASLGYRVDSWSAQSCGVQPDLEKERGGSERWGEEGERERRGRGREREEWRKKGEREGRKSTLYQFISFLMYFIPDYLRKF